MIEGMPYGPSNATAEDCFHAVWCASCRWWGKVDGCPTAHAAMHYDILDDEYPHQWRYIEARPTCTGYLFLDGDEDATTPRCDKTPDMFQVLG